jgi:hypothetical protein
LFYASAGETPSWRDVRVACPLGRVRAEGILSWVKERERSFSRKKKYSPEITKTNKIHHHNVEVHGHRRWELIPHPGIVYLPLRAPKFIDTATKKYSTFCPRALTTKKTEKEEGKKERVRAPQMIDKTLIPPTLGPPLSTGTKANQKIRTPSHAV